MYHLGESQSQPSYKTLFGLRCGFMVALLFIPFDNPLFGSLVLIAIGSAPSLKQ